ncbi:MAG TPA: hypothetical protein VIX80_01055 [Candidatus Kapabacteria bacterium]
MMNSQSNAVNSQKLYHISEDPNIKVFEPRPSPSYFQDIQGDVVFAISDELLHNYLLPRECPRVTFYSKENTTDTDRIQFLSEAQKYVVAIENKWLSIIKQTTLYCYELPADIFTILDEGAGYYISHEIVTPISVTTISDIKSELQRRNVELRLLSSLQAIAEEVSTSSLQFSLIRMRNAESN